MIGERKMEARRLVSRDDIVRRPLIGNALHGTLENMNAEGRTPNYVRRSVNVRQGSFTRSIFLSRELVFLLAAPITVDDMTTVALDALAQFGVASSQGLGIPTA